jgi:cytidine deaminase
MSFTQQDVSADANLLSAAKAAARHAYAPYSQFFVGCAVRTVSQAVYVGCNVESESFPAGVCAERAALAAAIAAEGPSTTIERILIYAIGPDRKHTACSPCGVCRQMIYEVAPRAKVGFFIVEGKFVDVPAGDLLPYAFRGHLR